MNVSFKKFLGVLGAAFVIGAIGNAGGPATVKEQTQTIQPTTVATIIPTEEPISTPSPLPTRKPTVTPVPTIYRAPTAPPANETSYGNNDIYINSQGNEVQSPGYYDSAPAGASAQCGDGTYSFSQSRRGTCSHHGGVAAWL